MRAAGAMQWTVRLDAKPSEGEVTTAELTFGRLVIDSTLADVGLVLSETKALSAKLQTNMLCDQVAEYAAHRRVCVRCGALRPLEDRRTLGYRRCLARSRLRLHGSKFVGAASPR